MMKRGIIHRTSRRKSGYKGSGCKITKTKIENQIKIRNKLSNSGQYNVKHISVCVEHAIYADSIG